MSLRRKIFYGFTLAVVALLLILPATGWLARLQLLPFTLPGASRLLSSQDADSQKRYGKYADDAVARNSGDFDLRFAHSLDGGTSSDHSTEPLRRLDKLKEIFPRNPAVVAAILKTMTQDAVKVVREEENLLSSPERRTEKPAARAKQSDPAQLKKFIALAEEGEALEPKNAYFSVLTAWGCFAARQDEKAVVAWIRAGEKAEWDDHGTEEIEARWKLQRAVNGGTEVGAVARMGSMFGILLPQYAGMRSSARMAAVMALQGELRGEKETGFTIRRAGRQIGQNMQEHCKSYIGSLVGRAIISLAMSRPGGEEYKQNPYKGADKTERWAKERQDHYADYLRSIGHPEEAVSFTAAAEEGNGLHTLFWRVSPKTYWGFEAKTFQLFGAWFANFLLIAGVLFSLVFAGVFKLVHRFSPRLQKGEPLRKSAKWGVTAGIFIPVMCVLAGLSSLGMWLDQEQGLVIASVLVLFSLVIPPVVLRLSGAETRHGLLVVVATLASFGALVGAGIACMLFAQGILGVFGMLTNFDTDKDVLKMLTPWAVGAMVLSVPLGLLLLFGIFSKILKVPFAAGVTRGMRAMAVPLACVLALAWSGTLFYTLKHERAAIWEMEQMTTIGEMQYLQQVDHNSTTK